MSRVAAIDCGTNSIRLLIADITGDNFQEIAREMDLDVNTIIQILSSIKKSNINVILNGIYTNNRKSNKE